MRCNENIKIVGKRVILVPYLAKHVEKYHQWMQSPDLRELTASEPLTLEEEYAMQRSWREDEDKLTFLVLCKETYDACGNEITALIGDTNLFFHEDPDAQGEQQVGEAEIMIAEEGMRRKGYGWEAMLLLMDYAQTSFDLHSFEAKIGMKNESSKRMFEKMQFRELSRSEVFQEITMRCRITENWKEWLHAQVTGDYQKYEE